MKRAVFVFLATLAGAWAFPWWWPLVPGLLAGAWGSEKTGRRVWTSALGAGLAWVAVAVVIQGRNGGLLSARIAPLFHLPGSVGLIAVTGLIGGVTAGLGAWVGARVRSGQWTVDGGQ